VLFVDEADAAAVFGAEVWLSVPRMRASPAVGARKPSRMRNSVDLPAPLAPTMAWMRPRGHAQVERVERQLAAVALAQLAGFDDVVGHGQDSG
jgi:hypothetical protein